MGSNYKLYERRRPVSGYYSDDDRPSSSPSSYSSCESVDEVVQKFRTYRRRVRDMVNSLSDLDDSTVINQGTTDVRQPQLGFHSVHGLNVELKRGARVARRRESFCKGLAFSNRPITIEENVCLRLTEVATNWSGVLRFGVTNVDPETFRNIQVPKFACPDLTSKDGYWAKALPERYSVEGNILHFYVTSDGELYYGINGTQKGVFLVQINTTLPLWIIVDIYGNSVAVEFVDPSDFRPPRNSRASTVAPRITTGIVNPSHDVSDHLSQLQITQAAVANRTLDTVRFHHVTGRHISLNAGRSIAERCEQEYTQGYVFTERPINNNEKIVIQVMSVQQLYNGGIAFGVTCCDPSTLRSTDLPDDSSDLIEMPQYWVGIKDIALQPRTNSILSFWITDGGEVKFEKDSAGARTVLHVDNSLPLFLWFDCYGSTQSIKLLGCSPVSRSHSPIHRAMNTSATRVALPSLPPTTRRNANEPVRLPASLRVDMRSASQAPTSSSSAADLLLAESLNQNPPRPPRRTVDDLLLGPSFEANRAAVRPPPPLTPRPTNVALTPVTLSTPTRAPPPTPYGSVITTTPANPPAPPPVSTIPPAPTIAPPARPSLYVTNPTTRTQPPLPPMPASLRARPTPPPPVSSASSLSSATPSGDDDDADECTICMSARINSVLYTCGHMCMCHPCAMQTHETTGICPLCRTPIKDVIKCFKS